MPAAARAVASTVTREGRLLLVRLPAGAAVVCDWLHDGTTGDVTDWVADLALIGWRDLLEATGDGRPEPAESVAVAALRVDPAEAGPACTVTYVHLPTRECAELPAAALELAGRGVTVQVTAGVAAEAAEASGVDGAAG